VDRSILGMTRIVRLTAVMTHPVQYFAPWFRYLTAHCSDLDLTVLYAIQPTPEQQGVGFKQAFSWDTNLTDGYRCRFVRAARSTDNVSNVSLWGLDVPEIGTVIYETCPDVVMINGWHSVTLLRAVWDCQRRRIPVLYRGDTHLGTAPRRWRGALWSIRTHLLLRLFSGYLSVGQRAHEYLLRHGVPQSRIFSAPHCVDNETFANTATSYQTKSERHAARASFGFAAGEFVVLFVGKLDSVKRPLDVVRAVARLGSDARLLMVGAGKLESQCRREAEKLGLRVTWAGFLNQSELSCVYAVADCLVLPSAGETWGLVVNEALATGLPCVVSDRVGCAPDLITDGETGAIFPAGDVSALVSALEGIRERRQAGHDFVPACRTRVARYSFAAATEGLRAACRSVVPRTRSVAVTESVRRTPRIIACCGGMVIVSGLERMTFEVLRVAREQGAAVHCIVNTWENHRIVALAEQIQASWSTGYCWYGFGRQLFNPFKLAQFLWDVLRTSAGLLKDAYHFRPTHVFLPDFVAVLRNAPALVLLRGLGVPAILRVGNVPAPGRFSRWLWGKIFPFFVSRFVANSHFGAERLRATGIRPQKLTTIRNSLARRTLAPDTDADVLALVRARRTLLCVGQIAPFKGTHLFVESVLALLALGYDIQAVIVGRIPEWPPEFVSYMKNLRQTIATAGAQGRVHFVGERQNVLAIMRASYLFGAPIVQEETFGNVVLEARSVGLPVVAFACGALPELVEHGVTGILCHNMNVQSLIAGLRFFLDDPHARDRASAASLACLARPDADHTPEEFRRRWWSLLVETQST